MKVNNRQLLLLSADVPDFEGRLHYKKIWSNWPKENKGFKERWFKLKYNMLFYFRMNDGHQLMKEPVGVFILENSDIHYEENGEVPFSFSIVFKNEPEIKYIFSARSDDVVFSWISNLRNSTYGYLKYKLQTLQNRVAEKTEMLRREKKDSSQSSWFGSNQSNVNNFADFNSQVAKLGFNSRTEDADLYSRTSNYSKVNKTDNFKDTKQIESNLIIL